jgi:diadenosine tetraphosphate (Ap4A) HIT family hydrolase
MKIAHKDCFICNRIALIKENKNPYFVKELETGYVVLGDYQFYKGYTLFLCKKHKSELHLLENSYRNKFLNEMGIAAEAVFKAFKPSKLNYELLGNKDKHMHWHLYPRYKNDPDPKRPIWSLDKSIRVNNKTKASPQLLNQLKPKLLQELNQLF